MVTEQTKNRTGTLDVADIKKNIHKFIEMDYMERKEGSRGYSQLYCLKYPWGILDLGS
jgi:hypothetical protein